MPEIIPPGGIGKKKDWFSYVYLIVGVIALIRGFLLLIDIAVGLLLIVLGSTAVSQWMRKK